MFATKPAIEDPQTAALLAKAGITPRPQQATLKASPAKCRSTKSRKCERKIRRPGRQRGCARGGATFRHDCAKGLAIWFNGVWRGAHTEGPGLFPILKFAPAKALPIAVFGVVCLLGIAPARAAASCEESAEIAVLPSPIAPWKGAPLRVLFAAEKPLEGELSLIAPDGSVAATIARAARRAALFLVRRGCHAGRGNMARASSCATAHRRMRHDHPRHRRERRKPPAPHAAAGSVWPILRNSGTARRKICIRPGSRSCSMRRSTPSRRGRHGTKCCATARAMSCSTIWVLAKTKWRCSRCAPTAPTLSTSCAPISHSRWACRSAIRIARAASAARRRSAISGSTSSIPDERVRRRRNRRPNS